MIDSLEVDDNDPQMTVRGLLSYLRELDPDLPVYVVGMGGAWTRELRGDDLEVTDPGGDRPTGLLIYGPRP